MKKFTKNVVKEFKKSFGRFLAIMAIIALGVGFLIGVSQSTPDMKTSMSDYLRENAAYDVDVKATYGLTLSDIEEISAAKDEDGEEVVSSCMPVVSSSVMASVDGAKQSAVNLIGMDFSVVTAANAEEDENYLNHMELLSGQYPKEGYKDADGKLSPMEHRNVDTGMGLERTLVTLNGYASVYETDVFDFAIKRLEELSGKKHGEEEESTVAMRIIADHTRTATFLIGDVKPVSPSNVDQGYVLRRLIRRAMRYCRVLGVEFEAIGELAMMFVDKYGAVYPNLEEGRARIAEELETEKNKFAKTIEQGLKEFDKILTHIPVGTFPGKTAFRLYDTFGFPIEMTEELAKERGYTLDRAGYEKAFKEHQEKSKAGAEQKFKGGLADGGEQTARLHSATHLLNYALKKVLGDESISQRGSNITPERLRFDFNFPRPLTAEEIKAVEDVVNAEIASASPVVCEEMTVDEAKAQGAVGVFGDRYGEVVKVYTIGHSKEICGGPHAANTAELGKFRIVKEQSSSAGVRRIKAVLE